MLHLHTSGRIEPLAAHLATVLSEAPSDPMTPEWIAVPSEGMRRWLSLELSRHLGSSGPDAHDGVAANIESAFPGSLRLRVLDSTVPSDEPDPWRVERLVWAVLAVADVASGDLQLAPLLDVPEGGSRYGRCRRVADMFDRYHVHRPDMVRAWADGRDVDGSDRPLAAHHRWQPHLWRRLRAHVGIPSPPERTPALLEGLHAGTLQVDLPQRLAMFGLSILPGGPGFLDLAEAVGSHRELHVFLVEPSPVAAIRIPAALDPPGDGPRTRAEDTTTQLVHHPLMRSWGRLHRETTVLLTDGERQGAPAVQRLDGPGGPRGADTTGSPSLLERLQLDIAADRAPVGDLVADVHDRSVQFHACHGPTRQVEVLRDVLAHLLADPELQLSEDDILVVCPALERFAPTIEAVLGPSADRLHADRLHSGRQQSGGQGVGGAGQGPPVLRYRVADRSIRSANPVLAATEALLDVVGGRFDAPSVLDLVALAPIRERLRLDDDDISRIGEWVARTNVRWGRDAHQRARQGVGAPEQDNTWRAATDRLLLGAAVADDGLALAIGDVAPHGIGSGELLTAGRLAELLWRLGELADETAIARPVGGWTDLVRAAAATLFATDRDDEWQMEALTRVLADVDEHATVDGVASTIPLEFLDLRRLLADRLSGAPGRPDFFRGGITISSMTPLRWVPHRAVVMLGVDQAAFGAGQVDGDDLAAATPLLGDRDGRAETRQSLLEAVLSARDRLVLIRDGHDVRTNHPVPPAVAVSELADVLVAMVDPADRTAFRDRLEVHHPRQPFDESVFIPDALVPGGPWGFDPGALAGAHARRARSSTHRPFLERRFPRDDSPVVELGALHAFLKHPIRHFMQQRLGIRLPRREDGVSALLPVALDPLERWKVGDRLLSVLLDGGSAADWAMVERRLGTLPPGTLGGATLADVTDAAMALVQVGRTLGVRPGPAEMVPVDVRLTDGTRVVGTVRDRLGRHGEGPAGGRADAASVDGGGPARMSYSRGKPEYRLAAWLDLMALVGSDPTRRWRAVGVYRGADDRKPPVSIDLEPRGGDGDAEQRHAAAVAALEVAVDCYRRGSTEPVPLFPKVSHQWFQDEARTDDWSNTMGFGDGDDVATSLVYGMDLETLCSLPATDDDPGTAALGGSTRVGRFATHLWGAVEASTLDRSAHQDVAIAAEDRDR